jgi:hypothetical protein
MNLKTMQGISMICYELDARSKFGCVRRYIVNILLKIQFTVQNGTAIFYTVSMQNQNATNN